MNDLSERIAEKAGTAPVKTNNGKPSTTLDLIKVMAPEIKKALPSVMTPDRFSRIAISAVHNTPKLAECTPISFLSALMNSAQLGLGPNTPLGQC